MCPDVTPQLSQFLDRSIPGFELDFKGGRRYRRMLAHAARLTGAARLRAHCELDHELSTRAAPTITFAGGTARDFFSATVGCQVFHPGSPGPFYVDSTPNEDANSPHEGEL